jgi:hypothetical protein
MEFSTEEERGEERGASPDGLGANARGGSDSSGATTPEDGR